MSLGRLSSIGATSLARPRILGQTVPLFVSFRQSCNAIEMPGSRWAEGLHEVVSGLFCSTALATSEKGAGSKVEVDFSLVGFTR